MVVHVKETAKSVTQVQSGGGGGGFGGFVEMYLVALL